MFREVFRESTATRSAARGSFHNRATRSDEKPLLPGRIDKVDVDVLGFFHQLLVNNVFHVVDRKDLIRFLGLIQSQLKGRTGSASLS